MKKVEINNDMAEKLIPSIARQCAMKHYVDSVGRSDIFSVSNSWYLEEIKSDSNVAKVAFADELNAALKSFEIDAVLLIKDHHITKAQLYAMLAANNRGTTIFEEV